MVNANRKPTVFLNAQVDGPCLLNEAANSMSTKNLHLFLEGYTC
jgi:hypothetical protein